MMAYRRPDLGCGACGLQGFRVQDFLQAIQQLVDREQLEQGGPPA
jgi:hypothetical protein